MLKELCTKGMDLSKNGRQQSIHEVIGMGELAMEQHGWLMFRSKLVKSGRQQSIHKVIGIGEVE